MGSKKKRIPPKTKPREPARPLTREELNQVMRVFSEETDRGCVIAAMSLMDDVLEMNLREKFCRDAIVAETDAKEMLKFAEMLDILLISGPLPPLGSFAMRANMCRALGLIDKRFHAALDELRLIRNQAAHGKVPFNLDEHPITKMTETLTVGDKRMLQEITSEEVQAGVGQTKARLAFTWVALAIYSRLMMIGAHPEQLREILDQELGRGLGEIVIARMSEPHSGGS
jgi:hypothetical protein